jgi:hypothetical protein
MRVFALGLAVALGLVAGPHSAGATPAALHRESVAGTPTVIPVAHHCGKGRHWVQAGYAKGGKYRAGHCAPASGY